MYSLGMSASDRDLYLDHLRSSHIVNVRVQVMDLDHQYVDNISDAVIDGQVTVDYNGDVATRSLQMVLMDPTFSLGFDSAQVIDGAWFYDRMIQVSTEVYVPALGRVINCPLFTGPVRKVKRQGSAITVDCDGKDVFTRKSWPQIVIKKGTPIVDAIRHVLSELGETFFRFEANPTGVTGSKRVIDRASLDVTPWGYCRLMAAEENCRLFYAADGYAVLRERNDTGTPVFTFRDGDGGSILTRPDTGGDYSNIANVIRAEGMPASGKPDAYEAMVSEASPLHPSKLLRGGKPMYMGFVIQRESITSKSRAKSVALSELADRQYAVYDIAFDATPLFPLEEGDVIGVQTADVSMTAPLLRFSFGFSAKAPMPIGYRKLIAPAVTRIRGN